MRVISEQKDCSLELSKARSYTDFLVDYVGSLSMPADGEFRAMLTENQFETISWMLSDIGILLFEIDKAVHGEARP